MGRSRLDRWQAQYQVEAVVGGYTVVALEAAAEAAMDDDVLAIAAHESANRRHRPAAGARAVTRHASIHVP
jgi:anti-sigma factor ChrR (cupin superfamily)